MGQRRESKGRKYGGFPLKKSRKAKKHAHMKFNVQ
jgi:hypothetical protein